MAKAEDQKILTLIKEVNRRKAEISKAEKPNWKTSCTFTFGAEGQAGNMLNLHVESDVWRLVNIAAFLQTRSASYDQAAKDLGVESPPPFQWCGFSLADWMDDLKSRITKIQISAKKKKLETLEARLNDLVSPELRRKLELDSIMAELDTKGGT